MDSKVAGVQEADGSQDVDFAESLAVCQRYDNAPGATWSACLGIHRLSGICTVGVQGVPIAACTGGVLLSTH